MVKPLLANTSDVDPTELSVLVPSCDAYCDLWTPFVSLFGKFWAECPFTVYMGSNHLSVSDSRIITLYSDKGLVWSDRLQDYLRSIQSRFVLIILEDFFLRDFVRTENVMEALSLCIELNANCVRLAPRPAPTVRIFGKDNFGVLEVGSPYRVSTQAAIWRKDVLLDLVRTGESIWEFEANGSVRSLKYASGFYGFYVPVIPYGSHVVERGKWFPWSARKYGKMKIGCDFGSRAIMTSKETLRWLVRKFTSLILEKIPWNTRLWVIQRLIGLKRAVTGHI